METTTTDPTPAEFLAIWETELADAKANDDGSYHATMRIRRAGTFIERARNALAAQARH